MDKKIPNFSESELKEFSFILKSTQGFLWRLWFLISAPIIWLIKGEVKIK